MTARYSILGVDSSDQYLLSYLNSGGSKNRNVVSAPYCKQIFVTLDKSEVSALKNAGYKVEPVKKVSASPIRPSTISPPIDIIGTSDLSPIDTLDILGFNRFKLSVSPPLSGAGYSIAVIDTGIRSTHQALGDKVVYTKNFTEDLDGDWFDHGTGVASIIHTVAPDAKILDFKALGTDGVGTEENVVLAINECIELIHTNYDIAPNIINMSIGGIDDNNPDNPLRVACREAIENGIVVVAAAGNDGPNSNTITVPACEEYVVAVGSVGIDPLTVSGFSSRGPVALLIKPDTTFIGENLIIASSSDDSETFAKSGTSFSTPLVAGIFLLIMEGVERTHDLSSDMYVGKNVLTSDIIIDRMLPTVCIKPEGVPKGKDNDYGYGLPVGSAVYKATVGSATIDINKTIMLSALMMTMVAMSRSITGDGCPARRQ